MPGRSNSLEKLVLPIGAVPVLLNPALQRVKTTVVAIRCGGGGGGRGRGSACRRFIFCTNALVLPVLVLLLFRAYLALVVENLRRQLLHRGGHLSSHVRHSVCNVVPHGGINWGRVCMYVCLCFILLLFQVG